MIYRVIPSRPVTVIESLPNKSVSSDDPSSFLVVDQEDNPLDSYWDGKRLYVVPRENTTAIYLIEASPGTTEFKGSNPPMTERPSSPGIPREVGVDRLRFSNFKGIAEGELDLRDVAIILGGNNAGKTTVLEAIYLLLNPDIREAFNVLPYLRQVDELSVKAGINEIQNWVNLFRYYQRGNFRIESGSNFVEGRYDNQRILLKHPDYEAGMTPGEGFSIMKGVSPESRIETLLFSPRLAYVYFSRIAQNWEEISNLTEAVNSILGELNEISNEKYQFITFEPFRGIQTLYLVKDDKKRVRIADVGEGFKIYVILRLMFEYYKPRVLLWDDIESHMNPFTLASISGWLYRISKTRQILVSTHSLEAAKIVMNATGKDSIIVDVIDGKMTYRRLSLSELERYEDLGVDPRTLRV